MSEPLDFGDLVAHYQVLCKAIQFFEPMGWAHPSIKSWRAANGLEQAAGPWQLPPEALWVLIQSLEKRLAVLQATAKPAPLIGGASPLD